MARDTHVDRQVRVDVLERPVQGQNMLKSLSSKHAQTEGYIVAPVASHCTDELFTCGDFATRFKVKEALIFETVHLIDPLPFDR